MPEYEIVCNPNYAKMFCIMKKQNGFWQQIGNRYTYKNNAKKALAKLQAK